MAALGTATGTVGAASAELVPENRTRHSLVIVNLSDEIIWLSEGQTAVASNGIPLAPAGTNGVGGAYIRAKGSQNTAMFIGPINAISDGGAGKTVSIMELDFNDQISFVP
jgi:hypothetical protein